MASSDESASKSSTVAGLAREVDPVVESLGRDERETVLDPPPIDRLVLSSSGLILSRARFARGSPFEVEPAVRLGPEREPEDVDPLARVSSLLLLSATATRFLDPLGSALFVGPFRSDSVAVLLDLDE